jgi:hypothetical protein
MLKQQSHDTKTAMTWTHLPDRDAVERTMARLNANGIEAQFVETAEEAKQQVLDLLPDGAEVMNMNSVTLDWIGLASAISESGKYNAVRNRWLKMDRATQGREFRQLGATPDWAVGSVGAVTEDGQVVVASATGSQMAAYVYGAAHVVWVVGVQKIVKNLDAAFTRINDYILPLESERVHRVYGIPGSYVGKLLVFNKESQPGRITLIFVNEALGY